MKNSNSSRVALIAGGAGGIGLATAKRLADSDIQIALVDLPGEHLDNAARQLRAEDIKVLAVPTNLLKVQECRLAVENTVKWGGRLDVVVNSAGLWLEGPSQDVTEDEWDLVMGVNLKGAFFLIKECIPHLKEGGCIVNIASDAGLVGNSGAAVYCASKGGLVLLTKALALELAPRGIRVNAVCPGDVETPMIDYQAAHSENGDPEGYKRALLAHYPQKEKARFILAAEVARMVAYLCEAEAAPVTGAALSIDFGVTAGY